MAPAEVASASLTAKYGSRFSIHVELAAEVLEDSGICDFRVRAGRRRADIPLGANRHHAQLDDEPDSGTTRRSRDHARRFQLSLWDDYPRGCVNCAEPCNGWRRSDCNNISHHDCHCYRNDAQGYVHGAAFYFCYRSDSLFGVRNRAHLNRHYVREFK